MPINVEIRFYEELNDFIPKNQRKKTIAHSMNTSTTLKDLIESYNVPHTEVDLILVNGESVGFEKKITEGDRISVYPVFESFDISGISRLRPQPLREARFILDVHLGKLARYLRMYGFDSLYRNDYQDDQIIQIAKEKNRIILTRDLGILKNSMVTHGYFVRSQKPVRQIVEILQRFDLKDQVHPLSRCIECNEKIEPVQKSSVEHLLKENTRKFYNSFFKCKGCRKIYWEGSHYDKMMARFK